MSECIVNYTIGVAGTGISALLANGAAIASIAAGTATAIYMLVQTAIIIARHRRENGD